MLSMSVPGKFLWFSQICEIFTSQDVSPKQDKAAFEQDCKIWTTKSSFCLLNEITKFSSVEFNYTLYFTLYYALACGCGSWVKLVYTHLCDNRKLTQAMGGIQLPCVGLMYLV